MYEHGYGADPASGRLLLLANRQEGNVIRGFRSTAGGTGQFDFIPGAGAPPRLTTELVVGDTPPAMYGTLPLIGAYGQAWVAENSLIPRGHVLAVASAGPNSPYNVLRFREHTTANLRGMKLVKGKNPDYPLIDSYYVRGFGTGVRPKHATLDVELRDKTDWDLIEDEAAEDMRELLTIQGCGSRHDPRLDVRARRRHQSGGRTLGRDIGGGTPAPDVPTGLRRARADVRA